MTDHRVSLKVIEGELGSAQFHVAAEFDGQVEDFHLDTGSTYTSVAYSSFTSTYPVTGSTNRMSAAGREKVEEQITLGHFRLGPITKSQLSVPRYSQERNQINRLGMNVLAEECISFNLKDWYLSMGETPQDNRFPLHTFVGNTFGIDLELSSHPLIGLWDTGAELSVFNRELLSQWPQVFHFVQKIDNGEDATGESVEFDLYECKDINIAGQSFSGTLMAMDFAMIHTKMSADIQVILGTNLLRGMTWSFDFKSKTWGLS